MTVIAKTDAEKMIEAGNAELVGVTQDNESYYAVINNFIDQRTDHYLIDNCRSAAVYAILDQLV